ncbi:MAG: thioredoxin family protein [Bacteroides sp.]|nr:thioredoxin family protein [Bacteroides sp.]MCM1414012.1 thioredoxin family protein [Bacteroides sp.]MCM1472293.1 thioredoxin family protein [Bacteroides sp.]
MDYSDIISSSKVVLVEFYATWCPHCQRMMPVVEQLKELLEGQVDVYQLDIDKNDAIAEEEDVQSTPTFILYRNGREVWRQAGEMDGQLLLSRIESAM